MRRPKRNRALRGELGSVYLAHVRVDDVDPRRGGWLDQEQKGGGRPQKGSREKEERGTSCDDISGGRTPMIVVCRRR